MLLSLDIRDILIIDSLSLEFQPGLNVLTGETGAGKSILLDALGFVLGWRGRADLVRQGASQGEVTAVFHLSDGHPARTVLIEAGLPEPDEGELILRRVNGGDGRKSAWINSTRASGDVLRRLSDTLVELHGQHDDRGLLNPAGHRALLDAFAGADLASVRSRWQDLRQAEAALEAARSGVEALRQEEDFLRHAVAELDQLDPATGEEAELDAQRRLMQGAEKIRDDIAKAHSMITGDGAEAQVSDAIRWLEEAAEGAEGHLDDPLEALGRALDALGEAEQGITACRDALDFDAGALDRVEERLFAIRGLARKHNVVPDHLGEFAEGLRQRLGALDAADGHIAELEADLTDARSSYSNAAAALAKTRRSAATRLEKEMAKELAPLRMERAVFEVAITDTDAGPEGTEAVTFRVATNPGAPAGALNKIASGGELSRFLLALKVCLTRDADGLTMIFDEIDRGVGGATADAVGRRLVDLADGGQILVVTHSPQVAALGGHHWRVEKRQSADATLSTVTPLGTDDRVDEIARMLSGDTLTDAARAAAKALLKTA